jgi:hypothetical protein
MTRSVRGALGALLCAYCAAIAWLLADPVRRHALFFSQITVPASAITVSPAELALAGYTQDAPEDMRRFLPQATAATAGAATDVERIQRLADAIHDMRRPNAGTIDPFETPALSDVANRFASGARGECGHHTWMLTGLARSIGIDIRHIIWALHDGSVGHTSLEFFSRDEQRWIYFDVNLNGFAVMGDSALSAADLRAEGAASPRVRFASTPGERAWDEAAFIREYAKSAFDWYAMSNDLRRYEPDRRFGMLAPARGLLTALPFKVQRALDLTLGSPQTRVRLASTPAHTTVADTLTPRVLVLPAAVLPPVFLTALIRRRRS